jgi:hypothetical protein
MFLLENDKFLSEENIMGKFKEISKIYEKKVLDL